MLPSVVVGFFTRQEAAHDALTVNAFNLQAIEEALFIGIIVAVALHAHAASASDGHGSVLVSRRAVLAAMVAVYDQVACITTTPRTRHRS